MNNESNSLPQEDTSNVKNDFATNNLQHTTPDEIAKLEKEELERRKERTHEGNLTPDRKHIN